MKTVKVRISQSCYKKLSDVLFQNYPDREAACFFSFTWEKSVRTLVLTINDLIEPRQDEIDSQLSLVGINEPYSLRCALSLVNSRFSVGLVHSHPEDFGSFPSQMDDEMDEYYAKYFSDFAPGRPYLSMILSKDKNGDLKFSGRIFFETEMLICSQLQITGKSTAAVYAQNLRHDPVPIQMQKRLKRVTGVMGESSAEKIWRTTALIIGAGGTGSALFHSLVRSGMGRIIIIDPEVVDDSNLERIHGARESDVGLYKVDVLKRFANEINPHVEVIAVRENAFTASANHHLVEADFIFGCTDSQTGRVIVSDISSRYLLPALHVNVQMTSKENRIVSEVIHITLYGPSLPCAYCRSQVDGQKLAQENMSETEKEQRKRDESNGAAVKGTYWIEEPILHTVGSLTTIASEMVATISIGLICGTHEPPASFIEIDIINKQMAALTVPLRQRAHCICSEREGKGNLVEPLLSNLVR